MAFPRPLSAALLAFLALSCSRAQGSDRDPAGHRLILTGSSTIAPLMTGLAAAYEKDHPGIRIDVQSGGSGQGIRDARSGVADFGMVSRNLRAEESDLIAWPVARDGVAMIVHADNPVADLSGDQIRAIYTGAIQDWSALGGTPGEITVVHKAAGRATLEVFLEHFGLQNPDVQADIIAGENEQAIKTVAGDPRAIGYVSIGTAEEDMRHGVAIQLLALDGIGASTAAVADGSFPMRRTLHLVATATPEGLAADFLAFVRSPAADALIRAHAFTPLQP